MPADRTGRVWEEVRRALGRLAGRVSSHSLPEAQAGIAALVRHSTATKFADPGAWQAEWQPLARMRVLPPPSAPAGGGGVDLASVATVIGADRALGAGVVVSGAACRIEHVPVHTWTLGRDMPGTPAVHRVSVRHGEPPVLTPAVMVGAASVRALSVAPLAPPKPKPAGLVPWKLGPPRLQVGLAPALRVPITCRRLASADAAGFAAERQLLATASGVREADVTLIGVFPYVPLAAVVKLSVVPDGTALQVWVRPGAAGRGIPTVTVVLGRQRTTGKILQAVRRGTV